MSVYSTEERIWMVTSSIRGMSAQEVVDNFAAVYSDRPIPSKTTVLRLHHQFNTTGCIENSHVKKNRASTVVDEEFRMNICLSIEENPTTNLTQLSDTHRTSRSSCYKALKKEKFKSFKVRNVQQLLLDDYFKRMQFCQYWMERINNDPTITNRILFTDESTFCTNGTVNKQNTRVWARQNPYIIQETHVQNRQKVNVWAGILGDRIIGPFFIEGSLTTQKYLELIQQSVIPALGRLDRIFFQHDGAPPHSAAVVTELLNATFPGRWIGRFGPLKWPARSPDISPLDNFYWGYISSKVYDLVRGRPTDVEDLQERIIEASRTITPRNLLNVRRHFYDCLGFCLAQLGGHFEQFI